MRRALAVVAGAASLVAAACATPASKPAGNSSSVEVQYEKNPAPPKPLQEPKK